MKKRILEGTNGTKNETTINRYNTENLDSPNHEGKLPNEIADLKTLGAGGGKKKKETQIER